MSQSIVLSLDLIEAKPGSGKPRLVGKGVTVQFLAGLLDHPDWPIERICQEFDLTRAEVHAAWAFYYEHQAEIDSQRDSERSASAQLQAQAEYQAQIAALKDH